MSIVVKVEHLSKSYIIRHQGQSSYLALRDVITDKVKYALHKTKYLVSSKPVPEKRSKEEFWALNKVSFEVQQGDRIGIIGRNGAGKSTLLKVLSRITEPTLGRVSIKGRIASLLEVGTGFHPELTGRENIYLNGAILGMHRVEIKQKFDEIVDFAGVEKFLDTPVKRYSSGMYVRLAFAVAAYLESEILVVDEVLAVGDAEFQKKCLGKMQDVSQLEGRTVFFVSHNLAAIEALCRRVIVLDSGIIKFMGDTKSGIDFYLNTRNTAHKNISLVSRKDRMGNGKVQVSSFSIIDSNNKIVTQVLSGESYEFKVEYINHTADVIDRVVISIDIYDEKEHRWLLLRSNFSSVYYTLKPGTGSISCRLDNFPLTLGMYYFSIYLSFADAEALDYINYVNHFEVIGGDFFGTGSIGYPPNCKILTFTKWS